MQNPMKFELLPYFGAPPLKFGMSQMEVINILGFPKVNFKTKGFQGAQLRYDHYTLAFEPGGALVHIGFSARTTAEVRCLGVELFHDDRAFDILLAADGCPYVSLGFIYLLSLGLRLGGFHTEADEGKTVSMFGKGACDNLLAEFELWNN